MHNISVSRRQLLASGLAASLTASAGCLSFGTNRLGQNSGTELTLSLTRVDGALRDRYVYVSEDPDDHWDLQALDAALNDEQYTTQLRQPFFARPEDPAWVSKEGTYYRLGSVVIDEVTETRPVLRLFETEDSTTNAVAGGKDGPLPESDHRAVHIAHMAARARGNEGGYPSGLVQRGGYVYRSETAREDSDLVGEDSPTHVTYRETPYEVAVTDEQFHEAIYRPTAEPVTDDPDRMEAILRATFVGARVSQDELSSEAQRIIIEADADEYSETHPFTEPYRELLRAIDKRPYADGNIRSDAGVRTDEHELLQYEDTYYRDYLQLTENSD